MLVQTPLIPRKKLPLLALVDSLPSCTTLSKKPITPSSKLLPSYPVVASNQFEILSLSGIQGGSSCILASLMIYSRELRYNGP